MAQAACEEGLNDTLAWSAESKAQPAAKSFWDVANPLDAPGMR
jgi:hypothetical protein